MTTIQSRALSSFSSAQSAPILQEEFALGGVQYILHLLWIGQALCKQTTGVVDRLCQEVQRITQGKAQLILGSQEQLAKTQTTMPNTLISFSVQFGDSVYGTLCIAPASDQPTTPALPFPIGQLLAQTCSWLLYTLEQSVFLQNQSQHLNSQPYGTLTKREREVLMLMCLGHDQKSIADKLYISPATVGKHRQHIYEQLGVHNEHDALLAAYRLGFFSILEQVPGPDSQ
ncbi:MAG TPA: LuxR C-terminal-related transcriptional regulator [Ktedonosporobacter sp.]|jgi:DNA-binding CsgD family transcriptional regulator|nr:LuxR C-terminal-related transcriptional regulator [Ktedonosporobacter sp.]